MNTLEEPKDILVARDTEALEVVKVDITSDLENVKENLEAQDRTASATACMTASGSWM